MITLRTTIGRNVPSKEEVLVKLKSNDESAYEEAKSILNILLTPKEFDLREVGYQKGNFIVLKMIAFVG